MHDLNPALKNQNLASWSAKNVILDPSTKSKAHNDMALNSQLYGQAPHQHTIASMSVSEIARAI